MGEDLMVLESIDRHFEVMEWAGAVAATVVVLVAFGIWILSVILVENGLQAFFFWRWPARWRCHRDFVVACETCDGGGDV